MKRRVFVTGLGMVSAIGYGVENNLSSLLALRSGIGGVKNVKTSLNQYPYAEVSYTSEELAAKAGLAFNPSYSRTFLLGICAVQEAIRDAACEAYISEMGFIGSTTVAGMDLIEYCYSHLWAGDTSLAHLIDSMDCSDAANRIASHIGFRNVQNISTSCSSSANAIMLGARMIAAGLADRILVGGMDSLVRFSINGFNSLEILSPEGVRPFDENRSGVTLGEGAAFLVLEAEECVGARRVYGEIKGWANANSAFHQTASSPNGDGALAVMKSALQVSALSAHDIDYVNAHGTGTRSNDLSEARAMINLFENKVPPFSSTKGYTGHTLAAAGAIEAIISLLTINHRIIFPNLGFKTPMSEIELRPVDTLCRREVRNVMSNSFGFGGADASLIISKV